MLILTSIGIGAVLATVVAPLAAEAIWRKIPVRYKAAGALGAVKGAGVRAYREAITRLSA